jgi:hypothetical protein
MKFLSLIYIQKAFDEIAGPLKNSTTLWDGSFHVRTKMDDQSKKLLGSYPLLVEKQNPNSTKCVISDSQLGRWNDKESEARLSFYHIPKPYTVLKMEERALVSIRTN